MPYDILSLTGSKDCDQNISDDTARSTISCCCCFLHVLCKTPEQRNTFVNQYIYIYPWILFVLCIFKSHLFKICGRIGSMKEARLAGTKYNATDWNYISECFPQPNWTCMSQAATLPDTVPIFRQIPSKYFFFIKFLKLLNLFFFHRTDYPALTVLPYSLDIFFFLYSCFTSKLFSLYFFSKRPLLPHKSSLLAWPALVMRFWNMMKAMMTSQVDSQNKRASLGLCTMITLFFHEYFIFPHNSLKLLHYLTRPNVKWDNVVRYWLIMFRVEERLKLS